MKDKELQSLLKAEAERQSYQLQMIPSENYVSKDVRSALGSVVMNKYSEGQPGKRYYRGNEFIDKIEVLTQERALKVFGLDPDEWGVCVQAVSGSVANLAVYNALLEPGDQLFGMNLTDGGHLSHGWKLPNGKKISFTSKIFKSDFYFVDEQTEVFAFDQIAKRAAEVNPDMVISGGTAYPRDFDYAAMAEIAKENDAYYLADIAHEAGLVAAGVLNSPFEHADVVTMTTRKTLRGPVGALIFARKDKTKDIKRSVMPGLQGGPMNHSIAGICVALGEADTDEFKKYAAQIIKNSKALADQLMKNGANLVSQGTDKHLMLINLDSYKIDGHKASKVLEKANIICNKNTIPGETRSPWKPSGIRLGTPSLTSRGMDESDMRKVGDWITRVLDNIENETVISEVAKEVKEFALDFPIRADAS